MKGFKPLSRTVELKREEGSISLLLLPTPPGFSELVDRHMPAPVLYVNGQPTDSVDPKLYPEYSLRKNMVLLGKSLGGQVDTAFPAELSTRSLTDFANAMLAEFEQANFTVGEVGSLVRELNLLNRGGAAKPPKAD